MILFNKSILKGGLSKVVELMKGGPGSGRHKGSYGSAEQKKTESKLSRASAQNSGTNENKFQIAWGHANDAAEHMLTHSGDPAYGKAGSELNDRIGDTITAMDTHRGAEDSRRLSTAIKELKGYHNALVQLHRKSGK